MSKEVAYLGNLDDFALRYNLPGACSNKIEELNSILLTQAFLGPSLMVNDGYFVNHPAVREAIISPKKSPLTKLTESSFISILTRNEGRLDVLVENMEEMGITTGRYLAKSNVYTEKLKPQLESWVPILSSPACNAFIKWPSLNMDESFYRTLRLGFDRFLLSQPNEQKTILNEFWNAFSSSKKMRRTEWEDIAKSWYASERISKTLFCKLMSIGNQAYQYSWACALTVHHNDTIIRVDTNASDLFVDLHIPYQIDIEQPRRGVRMQLPHLNSEHAANTVNGRWDLVAKMLREGHKVNIAKHEFMARLSEYPGSLCNKRDMDEATQQYADRLSSHFKMNVKWLPVTFDFTWLIGSTGAGLLLGGPVGGAVGFGIGVTGLGASHGWPGPKLYDLAATPNKKGWFAKLKTTVVDNSSSSLAINPEHARRHLKDVTEFST